jgi:hypothetical protein
VLFFYFISWRINNGYFIKKYCCFSIQQRFLPKNRCQFSINNNYFFSKNRCWFSRIWNLNPYAHSKTFACLRLSLENLYAVPSANSLFATPHFLIDIAFPSLIRALPPRFRLAIADHCPLLLFWGRNLIIRTFLFLFRPCVLCAGGWVSPEHK